MLTGRASKQKSLELTKTPEELKALFNSLNGARSIADMLQVEYSLLIYHLFKTAPQDRYQTFTIPKKGSGERVIRAPANALKLLQQKLNQVLQTVYAPKPGATGFVLGKSIVDNAKAHIKRRYVLNVDLEDFFPSINFGRVRGMFMALPYSRSDKVATYLAKICCHENSLPQGAPTSPVVSNMICSRLDTHLLRLAREFKVSYSRYADDITFSTDKETFPSSLAYIDSNTHGVVVGGRLQSAIESNGFRVNHSKVRLQNKLYRQSVTGLVVNKKVNVPREFVREIRAMLHAWEKFGLDAAQTVYLAKHKRFRFTYVGPPSFKAVVKGKLEFLGMVKGKDDKVYQNYITRFNILNAPPPTEPASVGA